MIKNGKIIFDLAKEYSKNPMVYPEYKEFINALIHDIRIDINHYESYKDYNNVITSSKRHCDDLKYKLGLLEAELGYDFRVVSCKAGSTKGIYKLVVVYHDKDELINDATNVYFYSVQFIGKKLVSKLCTDGALLHEREELRIHKIMETYLKQGGY